MRVLILGANGFIGRSVAELVSSEFETTLASNTAGDNVMQLNATDYDSVLEALTEVRPEYIINCAGIVQNSEAAEANVIITMNLLKASVAVGLNLNRFILLGSAAEYGNIDSRIDGISEDDEVKPVSVYGSYKAQETRQAIEFGEKNGIDVVVARLFNPIGTKMNERFLISALLKQIEEIGQGSRSVIEVSRLDSLRDYIDSRDTASAIVALLKSNKLSHHVYNVGSGNETSNELLIATIVEALKIPKIPEIIELQNAPELPVASKANITRITSETEWTPKYSLKETIMEIIEDAKR